MIYEVRVTPDLVLSLLKPGAQICAKCIEGVPEGAVLVESFFTYESGGGLAVMRFDVPSEPYGLRVIKPRFEDIGSAKQVGV